MDTLEPGHGFSARDCGTLWYEEDMTGAGRDEDRGWYSLHQLRSLNPSVLAPGNWHWVRCAGRSAIDGDLDSVDWLWAQLNGDPTYGDWESHWSLGEFYFQVQWECC